MVGSMKVDLGCVVGVYLNGGVFQVGMFVNWIVMVWYYLSFCCRCEEKCEGDQNGQYCVYFCEFEMVGDYVCDFVVLIS